MHGSTSVRCYEFHTRELFEAFANQLGEQVKTYLGKALAKMPTDTVINVAVGLDESNRPILAVEVLLMGVQSTYRLT